MRWVSEDYEALAGLIERANQVGNEEAALSPGKLVRRLRRGSQISQARLAAAAGVPRSLLERLESDKDVQLSSLRRVLAALGCRPVILPASEPLLTEFRRKAAEQRRQDEAWVKACRGLGISSTATASRAQGKDPL